MVIPRRRAYLRDIVRFLMDHLAITPLWNSRFIPSSIRRLLLIVIMTIIGDSCSFNNKVGAFTEQEQLLAGREVNVRFRKSLSASKQDLYLDTLRISPHEVDWTENTSNGRLDLNATGLGVTIYVIDSGIRMGHQEISGRAYPIENGQRGDFVGDEWGRINGADDCNGHGTHVAAIAAGEISGVAVYAHVVAVRVADCNGNGSTESGLNAISLITAIAVRPAVVLMSLNYSEDLSIRDAVEESILRGIPYVVAAGSQLRDACSVYPAGANGAITVAAVDNEYKQMVFSNWGSCIDIFAIGNKIRSAGNDSHAATEERSGSSQAAAYVAGIVALYLQKYPDASPEQVRQALFRASRPDVVELTKTAHLGDTPNRLVEISSQSLRYLLREYSWH